MGFVPDEEPKLVLLIVIDEPQGNKYGGIVAAPIFKAIMEKVLPYLNVLPKGTMVVKNELDSPPKKGFQTIQPLLEEVKVGRGAEVVMMPDLTGLSMRSALNRIEGKGLIIKLSGNGKVVEQVPRPGTVIEKGDLCFLKFRSPS
jgi:cell division protein FtsI (penicillin-binding protein 3)